MSRRKLITASAGLLLGTRSARAIIGGASSPDPYLIPLLPGYPPGYQNYGGRAQVTPSQDASTGVILIFGDSVPSNVVSSLYTATQASNLNFDVYNGGLYKSVEPLLGCNTNAAAFNTSGSFFTRVADTLITNSVYTKVILVPFGLGGSLLADYAAGGAINGIFAPVKARLDAAGLTATGIYCMLGANDTPASTSQASAIASLTSIISTIRALWATTPLFIAEHTIFDLTTNSGVQAAQAAVLDSGSAIYSGGNYDTLTSSSDYWDNTHPNATGAAAMASIAVTAITAHP